MSIMRLFSYVEVTKKAALILVDCLLCLPVCSQVAKTKALLADTSTPLTVEKLVQEVDLAFTVRDRHGRPVRTLKPEDIAVFDNGTPPEHVIYFKSHVRLPLRLALVIDTSDSVLGNADFEQKAAERFLKQEMHSASDVAVVVAFNERARIEQSAISDHHLLTRAIKHLPLGGNTAIFDAVTLASRQLGGIPNTTPSLRVIILMTDGKDNSSKASLQEAETVAEQNQTIVFTLNTGLEPLRNVSAEQNMKELAEVTGGSYFLAGEEQIRDALATIEDELRSQYVIGYKPAQAAPDGSFHKVSILVPKKFKVRQPQGYFAR